VREGVGGHSRCNAHGKQVTEVLCDAALELDGALGVGHLEAGHVAAEWVGG
jgi:hypothetical protein